MIWLACRLMPMSGIHGFHILLIGVALIAIVGVTDIQPQGALWLQHSQHLGEYLDELAQILFRRIFKADLPFDLIITKTVIRR